MAYELEFIAISQPLSKPTSQSIQPASKPAN